MAQEVKVPVTKFSHLNSIPGLTWWREAICAGFPLTFMHDVPRDMSVVMYSYTCAHTCTYTNKWKKFKYNKTNCYRKFGGMITLYLIWFQEIFLFYLFVFWTFVCSIFLSSYNLLSIYLSSSYLPSCLPVFETRICIVQFGFELVM